jgi:hypothetical protein
MDKQEIKFWREQADNRTLIRALRSDQRRAIDFFGAFAVLSENEEELYRTIEAYEIVNSEDKDLFNELNQISGLVLADCEAPPEVKKDFENRWQHSIDIPKLRKNAEDHLRRIHS